MHVHSSLWKEPRATRTTHANRPPNQCGQLLAILWDCPPRSTGHIPVRGKLISFHFLPFLVPLFSSCNILRKIVFQWIVCTQQMLKFYCPFFFSFASEFRRPDPPVVVFFYPRAKEIFCSHFCIVKKAPNNIARPTVLDDVGCTLWPVTPVTCADRKTLQKPRCRGA